MTDLDDRVRTLLEERARDHVTDPVLPRTVAARSRRRRALVGAGAGLAAVAVIAVGAAALRAGMREQETGGTPTPTPVVGTWRGIWPQATRAEAEDAQAAADAGEPDAVWQLDVVATVRRFAQQQLDFPQVHFDESLDVAQEDSPGPSTIHVVSCEPRDTLEWPPTCTERGDHVYATVTVERLLRSDRSGIWSVTEVSPVERATIAGDATAAPGVPETFVGLRGGEIVVVDVASGEVVRTLVDRRTLGGGSEGIGTVDLEVSPDGETVYFVPFGTPERIMRVPTSGGTPELIAEGRKPTLSPDGRLLAYVACEGTFAACGNAILVRDLAGGDTIVWDVGIDNEWAGQLAWLPDSRTLAFSMFYPGDSNPTLHVLDTVDGVGVQLKDVEKIGPEDVGAGWTVVGYHAPTEGFVVRHFCCTADATDEVEESSVISVAWNGQVVATLFDGDWLEIELDGSGRHFLLLEPGGTVYRMDEAGAEPAAIADGFEDVDW